MGLVGEDHCNRDREFAQKLRSDVEAFSIQTHTAIYLVDFEMDFLNVMYFLYLPLRIWIHV